MFKLVSMFTNKDVYLIVLHSQLQALLPHRSEVMKSLSLYYNTFVDLLDFKDKVGELLTTMDACQVHLDIVSYHFKNSKFK